MGEFFKPWQRKIGVVTLVISLMLTFSWIRSPIYCDFFRVCFVRNCYQITSIENRILWVHEYVNEGAIDNPFLQYGAMEIGEGLQRPDPLRRLNEYYWKVAIGDCFVASGTGKAGYPTRFLKKPGPSITYGLIAARIPHWCIVIPLTAISAFLLFKKPKTLTQKKTPEPIRNERV